MWNKGLSLPAFVQAECVSAMPAALRGSLSSAWGKANFPHADIDSFIEGPVFDRAGNLYLVDIPNSNVLRVTPKFEWDIVANTGGWPNGLAIDQSGFIWIADYRRGILRLDPNRGVIEPVLEHRNSESFKGLNDLIFDRSGNLYFTDQGQTGLHDPTGRVYRLSPSGQLDTLLSNVPSPNGLALTPDERFLYVAVTRANSVWRMPLQPDGSVSKVNAFHTFFGTSGPDGLLTTAEGGLWVAHASLGAFKLNSRGFITHTVQGTVDQGFTNVTAVPGTDSCLLTESTTGTIWIARCSSD